MKKTTQTKSRDREAKFCLQMAEQALDGFGHGSHLFGLTKGQFSIIDIATACLRMTGRARVCVWTWSIAEYEIDCMLHFLTTGLISDFRLLMESLSASKGGNISNRKHQKGNLIAYVLSQFGADSIRLLKNHAKIIMIQNDDWHIVIRGSMNLNYNPRFEQFDVSDDLAIYQVCQETVDEIWGKGPRIEADKISQADAIELFDSVGIERSQIGLGFDCELPEAPLDLDSIDLDAMMNRMGI
jgi:hypothetical protein